MSRLRLDDTERWKGRRRRTVIGTSPACPLPACPPSPSPPAAAARAGVASPTSPPLSSTPISKPSSPSISLDEEDDDDGNEDQRGATLGSPKVRSFPSKSSTSKQQQCEAIKLQVHGGSPPDELHLARRGRARRRGRVGRRRRRPRAEQQRRPRAKIAPVRVRSKSADRWLSREEASSRDIRRYFTMNARPREPILSLDLTVYSPDLGCLTTALCLCAEVCVCVRYLSG